VLATGRKNLIMAGVTTGRLPYLSGD
jgi:hypothetical protein